MRFCCCFNFFFPSTLLARVFALNYVLGCILLLSIGLIRILSSNQDLLFRFPVYTHVSYFFWVGISNVLASYKDVRKPVEINPRYAYILRAFVLWTWLFFVWFSANFLTLLNFKNYALFASFYFFMVIAINAILYDFPKIEISSTKLKQWRIGLFFLAILYVQSFFAIQFEIDNNFKILIFRMIEVSYFVITNCIISMIAGIDREIVGPVEQQEDPQLIAAV